MTLKWLRRDLENYNWSQSRAIYGIRSNSRYFWQAKKAQFIKVAEQVYQSRRDSGRSVSHIAGYLFSDLQEYNRAIEILLIAHRQQQLGISQQMVLVDYLHRRNRYAESIGLLEPIVEAQPTVMSYRTRLITAYHHASRPTQRDELIAATEAFFRQRGRWTEPNIASLARTCHGISVFPTAVRLYTELIALRQRTTTRRTGDNTLSGYYQIMARCYASLGDTIKAVDAASAAVVIWGSKASQRKSAISTLVDVIESSKDLAAFTAHLDRQAKQTGQDSPLLRRSVGTVYLKLRNMSWQSNNYWQQLPSSLPTWMHATIWSRPTTT